MQAVYFIALFGLVFAVISSFTVGIGANSMQIKETRLEETQRNFDNLEFAINSVVLKERTSLDGVMPYLNSSVSTLGEADLVSFLPFMRSSTTDLVTDSWHKAIRYYAIEIATPYCRDDTVDAKSTCFVDAPVVYFVMVSAGPNRTFESGYDSAGGPPNDDALAFLNYPTAGDDIVKVFSTDGPMRAHYNNMIAVQDKVAALILKNYRDQSAAFFASSAVTNYIKIRLQEELGDNIFDDDDTPPPPAPGPESVMEFNQPFNTLPSTETGIQLAEEGEPGEDPPGGGCGDDCLGIDITQEEIYGDILTKLDEARLWDGYPEMRGSWTGSSPIPASAYGAQSELQYDPFCGEASDCTPFVIRYDDDTPWQVVIDRNMGLDQTGGWLIRITQTIDGLEDL